MHSRFPIWVRSGLLLAVLAGSQTGCKAWKMPGADMFPWSKKPSQDKLLGSKPPTNLPGSSATTLVQDSSGSGPAMSGPAMSTSAASSGPVSPAPRNTPSPLPHKSMATRPPCTSRHSKAGRSHGYTDPGRAPHTHGATPGGVEK